MTTFATLKTTMPMSYYISDHIKKKNERTYYLMKML